MPMKSALFEAQCEHCRYSFSQPHLSNFNYVDFLFTGEKGTVYGYFYAIDNPVWNYVDSLFSIYGNSAKSREGVGAILQTACAYLADPIEGQRLRNRSVCPICQSARIKIVEENCVGLLEIPSVSFSSFMSMSDSARQQLVLDFFASYG